MLALKPGWQTKTKRNRQTPWWNNDILRILIQRLRRIGVFWQILDRRGLHRITQQLAGSRLEAREMYFLWQDALYLLRIYPFTVVSAVFIGLFVVISGGKASVRFE